jgi:hypothetical protein
MDGRHFDAMARALADDRSRRAVLRGLLGTAAAGLLAGVRGRSATAQEALPPGAECTDDGQCSQVGGAVVCADNGYVADGELNCCRNAGGACSDETYGADCCSGLYCRDGACTDLSVTGDLPVGSYCTASSQCSQDGGSVVCADNDVTSDGALNCCRNAGGACSGSAGCCGGLTCQDGVCTGEATATATSTPTADGLPLGAACAATAECAPADNGAVFCAANGIGIDGALNCCLGTGGACGTTSSLCCGTNLCIDGVCGG